MKQIRHQIPICLIVATIIALWTLTTAVRTSEARAALRRQIAAQRTDAGKYAEQVVRLEALQAETRRLNSRAESLSSSLASLEEGDALITRIRQLAELNTLAAEPIKTISSTQNGELTIRTLHLRLAGGFNGFYAYLLQLETVSPSVAIVDLQLVRLDAGDAELSADVTVQLLLRGHQAALAGAGGSK